MNLIHLGRLLTSFASMSALALASLEPAWALTVDLLSNATGTLVLSPPVSDETRALEVTVLGTSNVVVQGLTLKEGVLQGPTNVGARIYTSSGTLVARSDALVGAGFPTIPIPATLLAGQSYRVAFFIPGPGFDGGLDVDPPGSSISAFTEPTGTFLVTGSFRGSGDVFPSGANNLAPRIAVEVVPTTERMSVKSDGSQAIAGGSGSPSISTDGRFLAFASDATNLVAGVTTGGHIFVHDRLTGNTELVDLAPDGTPGNDAACCAAISADGRVVAFTSLATNLVAGQGSGVQVFVRDRVTGTTEKVSVSSDGTEGNSLSFSLGAVPSISADGRFVAFASVATNLVAGDTNGHKDIFVRDRVTHRTERVSVSSTGAQGDGDSDLPSISADGHYVAYISAATNLVSGDTNGKRDVFVRDRVTGITERVSVSSGGTQANGHSGGEPTLPPIFPPSISGDGRFVAFASEASNLVTDDTNHARDIFVRDRVTRKTERASVSSSSTQADNRSLFATISADGRFVAFFSAATNLGSGTPTSPVDFFVRDRALGTTEALTVGSSGSDRPSISAHGRFVAFDTDNSNLVAGDTNGQLDVFVRDRRTTLGLPALSINDAVVTEGAAGSFPAALFTVTLLQVSQVPVTVDFWVDNGSARAGRDYNPRFGTLTFNPGETAKTISVTVIGDSVFEPNETFVVNLDVPVNAAIARGRGTGTIVNDDPSVGTFELTPAAATVATHEHLVYTVTWTVPPPLNWHNLESVQLRISDDQGTILQVRFTEADGTLSLVDPATGEAGPGFSPGINHSLKTKEAVLHLAESHVQGSGPTGPSVTLTLSLSFKHKAAGRTYAVEVIAIDDAGHEQIEQAGTLTVIR